MRTRPGPKAQTKPRPAAPTRHAGISDTAVRKATGRTWAQWIRALDGAGCRAMTHREIAVVAHRKFGAGAWWSQMVTVGYEQAAGLRRPHQRADRTYSVSCSRVVGAPASRVFDAWIDERLRERWLPGGSALRVRRATKNKSLRITWTDGTTSLEVGFATPAAGRCRVAVEHSKLPSARQARQVKAFWGMRLGQLRQLLEAGCG